MHVEFIFFLTLMWLGKCDKCRQGTTVLTDEYKKVVDQFDFSSFDKQEGLNYIDRQRYDNQIRGKRSGLNSKNMIRCHYNKNLRDANKRPVISRRKKLIQIKDLMSRLKRKINEMQAYMNQDSLRTEKIRNKRGQISEKNHKKDAKVNLEANKVDNERRSLKKKKRHWDRWTDWSPCSVTCGKGRKVRWRRCLSKICETGELEMGEKTCQLPACNVLSKFLDILS